jgi:tetratricopeptide (TPR) repeat protein
MTKPLISHQLIAMALVISIFACTPAAYHKPEQGHIPPGSESHRKDNSYYYYTEAQLAIKKGQMDHAIQLLEKASAMDPASVFLYLEMASLYLSQKKTSEAVMTLEKGLVIDPEHVDALIFYGNINRNLNQNDKAKQAYSKVVELAPQKEERVHLLLGNILMEEGDLDRAMEIYQGLVTHFPGSFAGHFFIGKIYAENNQPLKAETAFSKALALEPDLEEGRFELLKIYSARGENEKVRTLYLELLDKNPNNIRAAMELGLFYQKNGFTEEGDRRLADLGLRSEQDTDVIRKVIQLYIDPKHYDDAIIVLEGMLKGLPNSSDLLYLAGVAYDGKEGEDEKAIQYFTRVSPSNRFYENAVVHTSVLFQEQQKINEAIDYIKSAIKNFPENPEFILYLGSFYEEIEAYADAETTLKKGLEIAPEHIRIQFRLGVVYDKWGKKSESIASMQKVISLDPKNANALNYLGYTYADMGENLDEAESLIREALKYKPNDGYITDSLGWVLFKKGLYQEALIHLEKAVQLTSDDPIILEHLGDAYLKVHDKENALKYYKESLHKRTEDTESLENKINDLQKP